MLSAIQWGYIRLGVFFVLLLVVINLLFRDKGGPGGTWSGPSEGPGMGDFGGSGCGHGCH